MDKYQDVVLVGLSDRCDALEAENAALLAEIVALKGSRAGLEASEFRSQQLLKEYQDKYAALKLGIGLIAEQGCLYSRDYWDGTCKENAVSPGCATCQARALLDPQAAEPGGRIDADT